MPFSSILVPEQLDLLTKVLNEHCRQHAITGSQERDDVARRLLALFQTGTTDAAALGIALTRATP